MRDIFEGALRALENISLQSGLQPHLLQQMEER